MEHSNQFGIDREGDVRQRERGRERFRHKEMNLRPNRTFFRVDVWLYLENNKNLFLRAEWPNRCVCVCGEDGVRTIGCGKIPIGNKIKAERFIWPNTFECDGP